MTTGNVRRSMGPIRWWFWQRRQRGLAWSYGYNNAFWGRVSKDPTALSNKIDPELGDIFQEEYHTGYAWGYRMRWAVVIALLLALWGLAAVAYTLLRGG